MAGGSGPIGISFGVLFAICAATAFAVTKSGIAEHLFASDIVLCRYLVAGTISASFIFLLPRREGGPMGVKRAVALFLLAGPPFAFLQAAAFGFAPLAHGVIIAPSLAMLFSTGLAVVFLKERPTSPYFVGVLVVIAALVLISWDGLLHPIQAGFWVGDAMFALTALQWAGFSLLLKTWRLDPVRVTALVSALGLTVVLPAYLVFIGPAHLATLSMKALSIQAIVQGVINGLLLVFAFGKAVQNLDVSRAALFPAAVPALAIIIGIPVAGDVPTALQLVGLFLATIGLVLASRKAARS